MVEYPDWVKETVKNKPVSEVKDLKLDTLKNVQDIKSELSKIIICFEKELFVKWGILIGKVEKDSSLIQTEIEMRDAAKQLIAFVNDLHGFVFKLEDLENTLKQPKVTPKKKAIRQQVERENVNQEDVFQVVDPAAIGDNKVRDVSLSLLTSREAIDQITNEEYVVLAYWTDSWTPILQKEFANQDEAQKTYDNYKLKLAEIHKLIQNGDLESAEKVTKGLIETAKSTTQPLIEDKPPINNANE